jgi:hypothetical protein
VRARGFVPAHSAKAVPSGRLQMRRQLMLHAFCLQGGQQRQGRRVVRAIGTNKGELLTRRWGAGTAGRERQRAQSQIRPTVTIPSMMNNGSARRILATQGRLTQ